MNQPFLSVIVPCYNVDKYVDKCISSIVGQIYPHLEILLVDDGSTDKTGIICDEWQAKDERIRVIHQQNEGSSYARKKGLEHASADFVTFVDADDWIDKDMYTGLMSALLSTGSDIAHCDFCMVYEDGRTAHRVNERQTAIRTMGRIESVLMILKDHEWKTHLGCKIYRKTLFEGIEFPKNRVYAEDMIVHEIFHKTAQTVFVDAEYYYYLVRSGSLTRQGDAGKEMKNMSDLSDAYFERYSFVKQHPEYSSAMRIVKFHTIVFGMYLLRNMIVCPQYFNSKYFFVKSKQLRSVSLTREDWLRRGIKMELYLLRMSPWVYKALRSLYVRVVNTAHKYKLTGKQEKYFLIDDIW